MQAKKQTLKIESLHIAHFKKKKRNSAQWWKHTHTQCCTSKWNTQPTQKNGSDNDNAQMMKAKKKFDKVNSLSLDFLKILTPPFGLSA
jgi:hypothetical protein